jgi:polyisoprenoid-binding protein YceI
MRPAALILAFVFLASTVALADSPGQRPIDPEKSKIEFSIQHVFVTHVNGTIPVLSGSVSLTPDSPIPVSATAVLDATKLTTGDHDQTGCLQSPDYFDTKRFPTWTFTSTKITPHGASGFGMDGNLTIHGVTQPEHLDVTIRGDAAHVVYEATGQVDRYAFGMKGTRLDPVIGKVADVTLDIALK